MKLSENENNLLIAALRVERDKFIERNQDVENHDLAIKYLETGVEPKVNIENFDILDTAVNDLETLYSDYCR